MGFEPESILIIISSGLTNIEKRVDGLQVVYCQRRSKSAQIRRNESAQIYKYLPPSISLTQFLNSYAGVSPAFFVP
jgi:hypothetical protein